jgi:hypothetical protein
MYFIEHCLMFSQEIRVGKAKHAITTRRQPLISVRIVHNISWFPVLASVELDDEFRSRTVEVNDVGTNRMLASKPETCDLLASKKYPKLSLCIRGTGAKPPCQSYLVAAASHRIGN